MTKVKSIGIGTVWLWGGGLNDRVICENHTMVFSQEFGRMVMPSTLTGKLGRGEGFKRKRIKSKMYEMSELLGT